MDVECSTDSNSSRMSFNGSKNIGSGFYSKVRNDCTMIYNDTTENIDRIGVAIKLPNHTLEILLPLPPTLSTDPDPLSNKGQHA